MAGDASLREIGTVLHSERMFRRLFVVFGLSVSCGMSAQAPGMSQQPLPKPTAPTNTKVRFAMVAGRSRLLGGIASGGDVGVFGSGGVEVARVVFGGVRANGGVAGACGRGVFSAISGGLGSGLIRCRRRISGLVLEVSFVDGHGLSSFAVR